MYSKSVSRPFLCLFVAIFAILQLSQVHIAQADRSPGIQPVKKASVTGLNVSDLSGSLTPTDLASTVVGKGVTISNVSYIGSQIAAGTFVGGGEIIGFDSGIVLSSGAVASVVGPNGSNSMSTAHGLGGDSSLDLLSGHTTYDAAILEFDFVPDKDHVTFQFVFASEEYNEYANSLFNDVFGFFINGSNCALVAGDPVSVNTVNYGNPYGSEPNANPDFYINNDLASGSNLNTEMDGLTKVLACSAAVSPGQQNHMKLAVADASDGVYDAVVFIQAASLTTERRPVILLPGLGASFNSWCILAGWDDSCNDDSKWGWVPTGEGYYEQFIERMAEAGYDKDNYYATVFWYDWTEPLETNIPRLKKHIKQIKDATKAEKVDLVGHSMGGLLGRAYIQSENYDSDVAHLVTLGSPHKGAAKAYPYWEGGKIYQGPGSDGLMNVGLNILIAYFRYQHPIASTATSIAAPIATMEIIRAAASGVKDILPTEEYLYDQSTGSAIPESQMKQRNLFLASLNSSIDQLFNRTKVATIYSNDVEQTPYRFYVRDRHVWEWPLWEDGVPIWNREDEFWTNQGDGTVPADSAIVHDSRAEVIKVSKVIHSEMADDGDVVSHVMNYLGISVAPKIIDPVINSMLAMLVSGPAQMTVIDPLGRTVSTGGLSTAHTRSVEAIPGVEVIAFDDDPVKMVLIPAPGVGNFQILIDGEAQGDFIIAKFDNNEASSVDTTDIDEIWDPFQTATKAGATTKFTLHFTDESADDTNLHAVSPAISTPLHSSTDHVTGIAEAGATVKIYDADTQSLLGTAIVNSDGAFSVNVTKSLKIGQHVYADVSGTKSITVTVTGAENIFLPTVVSNK